MRSYSTLKSLGSACSACASSSVDAPQFRSEPLHLLFGFGPDRLQAVGRLVAIALDLVVFGLEHVDLFQRLEDLVGQDAVRLLVGVDLFLQGLVFAIAPAGVEFDLEVRDPRFALAELQLSLIGLARASG